MTSRWKLGIGLCLAVCAVGLVAGICVHRLKQHRLVQAASISRARAEKGDAKAQFDLASMYFYGKGVPQDYAEAVRWCRAAAEQGDPLAESVLGSTYLYGNGVPQDYTEAARWYRKAAEHGNPKGQLGLASAYFYGKGMPQDFAEAAHWYRKAADQGDAAAQFSLGYVYREGKGVQQDNAEAIGWYRKAANQGDSGAEYALGYMYYYGQGLPQDYREAVRWYRKAADHGYLDAQRALASVERKSTARKIDYFGFLVSLVGGLIFSLDFLRPGRSFRNSRHETALGVVALCYAALSLYGITNDHMRYSAYHNLFHWGRGLLGGMAIILSMPIILSKRNSAESKLEKSGPK